MNLDLGIYVGAAGLILTIAFGIFTLLKRDGSVVKGGDGGHGIGAGGGGGSASGDNARAGNGGAGGTVSVEKAPGDK